MNIKISVYNTKQFKKHGTLKKNAKAEKLFLTVETTGITEVYKRVFFKDIVIKIKKDYVNFTSPYIFTHIKAENKETGEPVCIFENVGQFTTTPKTLFELLTK